MRNTNKKYKRQKRYVPKNNKATNLRVTPEYLSERTKRYDPMLDIPRWIGFCQEMLQKGYEVFLYEARQTFSKYITVAKNGKQFKVRFSNHKPIRFREERGDCDFFVGHTHLGVTMTHQAVDAVDQFFNQQRTANA